MSKYCEAGKMECGRYSTNKFDHTPGCNWDEDTWVPLPNRGELCPWPSRQVVEPKNNVDCHCGWDAAECQIIIDTYKKGRADAIRQAVEAIKNCRVEADLADCFELPKRDWDKKFPLILRDEAIAALKNLEVKL